MKIFSSFLLICLTACSTVQTPLISPDDMAFLKDITKAVVDSSRILPGGDLPPAIRSYGPNRSGITLIKPGGRDCYPSFWIRDYAMSLECGFITEKEQIDILMYTAARQSDSTWTTKTGSLVPRLPVYFPGTYDHVYQGNEIWRTPPYCDQFYFVHMAWYYLKLKDDTGFLDQKVNDIRLFDRLEMAFQEVPFHAENEMVFINDSMPTSDFGFRDAITITGEMCFGSLLRYRAAMELADLAGRLKDHQKSEKYSQVANTIKANLVKIFADERGILRASTGKSRQPDVWATAFAVYIGALEGKDRTKACNTLAQAYHAGTLAMEGQIRHVLTTDDFSPATAWEKSLAGKNTYQNGAYWGTATGWVYFAIAQVDKSAAGQLATEYITYLRKTDFRLPGADHGGPYECIYPPTGHKQNPVYMTSVTGVYAAFMGL
jgi:hypothetical protein